MFLNSITSFFQALSGISTNYWKMAIEMTLNDDQPQPKVETEEIIEKCHNCQQEFNQYKLELHFLKCHDNQFNLALT